MIPKGHLQSLTFHSSASLPAAFCRASARTWSSSSQLGQCQEWQNSFPKTASCSEHHFPMEQEPLQHRVIIYNLLVLTQELWKQTISGKKAGGDGKVLPLLCLTAWGCVHAQPAAPAWQRAPDPCSVCELQQGQLHSTLRVTPALCTAMTWTLARDSCKDYPRPRDTALARIKGTYEQYGWLVSSRRAFMKALIWLPGFCRKHIVTGWCQVSQLPPAFLSFSLVKIKSRPRETPDIHHDLADRNASDFTVIWASECQSLFLFFSLLSENKKFRNISCSWCSGQCLFLKLISCFQTAW